MPRRFVVVLEMLSLGIAMAMSHPLVAAAQVRVEITPGFGVYAGLASFERPATGIPFDFAESLSQRTAVAIGLQATMWLGERVGIRALGYTAASAVGPDNRDILDRSPVPATVTTFGLMALIPLSEFAAHLRVYLIGGGALVDRGGDAYQGYSGTSDFGGIFGIGSQYRLSDRLSLQGDFQTMLYDLSLTDPTGLQYPSAFQTDILASIGVTVRLAPDPQN
jgi:hypothetical protein